MHPPPYPPLPSEVETLPGIDQEKRIGRLVQENTRLRRERDEARRELAGATTLAPPRKRALPLTLGKYTVELAVLALAVRAVVGRVWPAYAELVDSALGAFGL
jgi:hypothetical protein